MGSFCSTSDMSRLELMSPSPIAAASGVGAKQPPQPKLQQQPQPQQQQHNGGGVGGSGSSVDDRQTSSPSSIKSGKTTTGVGGVGAGAGAGGGVSTPPTTTAAQSSSQRRQHHHHVNDKNAIQVFFGTCGGTAEKYSWKLARAAATQSVNMRVRSMSDLTIDVIKSLPSPLVIIASSTGFGDPPPNATAFSFELKKKLTGGSSVKYAVFGLGDSSYRTFLTFPRLVDDKLCEMGGTRLLPLGVGDACKNQEESFQTWCQALVKVFVKENEAKVAKELVRRPAPMYTFIQHDASETLHFPSPTPTTTYYPFRVESNIRTAINDRSISTLTLCVPEGVKYARAGHVRVMPRNLTDEVRALMDRLEIRGDTQFTLQERDGSTRIPPHTSFQTAFDTLLDIHNINQEVCMVLAKGCGGEQRNQEETKLKLLAAEWKGFQAYVVKGKRTLLQLLKENPSCKPDIGELIWNLHLLQPRSYSVTTSPLCDARLLSLVFRVVDVSLPGDRKLKGVCSNYLHGVETGDVVQATVAEGVFPDLMSRDADGKLIPRVSKSDSLMMFAAGTGIAPCLSLLQHAQFGGFANEYSKRLLFFGCQNPSEFVWREQIDAWLAGGVLTRAYIAYSRTQTSKRYIQHEMLERGEEVVQMLTNHDARMFVCGSVAVGQAVCNAFVEVLMQHKGMTREQAVQEVDRMKEQQLYIEELWAV